MGDRIVRCWGWRILWSLWTVLGWAWTAGGAPAWPEHPRPDFQRDAWLSLDGPWQFRPDPNDRGLGDGWMEPNVPFEQSDHLSDPFEPVPPGTPLWQRRSIEIPQAWDGLRVLLVADDSDGPCSVWIDGQAVGEHLAAGPFQLELTGLVATGRRHWITLRRPGAVRGSWRRWESLRLEARPQVAIESLHFTPDLERQAVQVEVLLDQPILEDGTFELYFFPEDRPQGKFTQAVRAGTLMFLCDVNLPSPRLWSPEDPHLYQVDAVLRGSDFLDRVGSYFGMRQIGTGPLPGTNTPYVTINDRPVYLQMITLPAEETFVGGFGQPAWERLQSLGFNAVRVVGGLPSPRWLHWADRHGLLTQVPGPALPAEADANDRWVWQAAFRQQLQRDFNHPAVFSWSLLDAGSNAATANLDPEWIARQVRMTRQLDPTRLIEDRRSSRAVHVATDLNTWVPARPLAEAPDQIELACRQSQPGSQWNFADGTPQNDQPLLNAGWTPWPGSNRSEVLPAAWTYHELINTWRRYGCCAGWLLDVPLERVPQRFDLAPDRPLGLADLHGDFYVVLEPQLCTTVWPGATRRVPVFLSCMTDRAVGPTLYLEAQLSHLDRLAQSRVHWATLRTVEVTPWMQRTLEPLEVTFPDQPGLATLQVTLKDVTGQVLHRNVTTYHVDAAPSARSETLPTIRQSLHVLRVRPDRFTESRWSGRQWIAAQGRSMVARGRGFVEYAFRWPVAVAATSLSGGRVRLEVGLPAGADPAPLRVRVNGDAVATTWLDGPRAGPAGVLSCLYPAEPEEGLSPGAYGTLVEAVIDPATLRRAYSRRRLVLRLEVEDDAGLVVFGEQSGRVPIDPTIILVESGS